LNGDRMTQAERHLQRILKASARVQKAEGDLVRARELRREAMRAALEAGVSKAAIARALGVSRQRVQAMLRE